MARPPSSSHRRRRFTGEEDVGFSINDSDDLLAEILSRLDGRSLGVAACVCRQWRRLCLGEGVWERLCDREGGVGARERRVVAALGGYRRLYRVCVGPVLERRRKRSSIPSPSEEAKLSMMLFSVDCYERRMGGRRTSLMFLCTAR